MTVLTVFDDLVLQARIVLAAGLRGKAVRHNIRTRAPNGQIAVNIVQARTTRQYEFAIVPVDMSVWQMIEGIVEVTEFGAYGFLMEDPKDTAVDASAGLLYPYTTALLGAIGLGYGVPSYKMYKRYTALGSTRTKDRAITRPQATPALLRAGAAVTLGVSAGNAAINYGTGLVTFVADTSQAIASITAGAGTVLNFANGTGMVAAMAVGQRVYITGVTGTAASSLNSKSHVVASKGATSLTLSTGTAGLAVTLPGTAFKYPQASETLRWSGKYYVPVHIAEDTFDWSLVRPAPNERARLFIGPSMLLEEVPE